MAQDTGGREVSEPFYEAAKATYSALTDERHVVSSLYGLVNVPSGIMVDEEGRIVRLDEGTYTREYQAGQLSFGTNDYVPILRDWIERGAESEQVFDVKKMTEQLSAMSDAEAKADAHFRLASYFKLHGRESLAQTHWSEAQRLNPDSWNYHRQDWSFSPEEAGRNWFQKFQSLGDEPYYRPLQKSGESGPDE